VRDTRGLDDPDQLELGLLGAEQPPPVAEQDRDQVDLQLVEHACAQQRLGQRGAVDHHVRVTGRRLGLAQSLLREGLIDELEIHLIPVVLGDGRRLFGAGHVELELRRVLDAPGVTHLRYRVVR